MRRLLLLLKDQGTHRTVSNTDGLSSAQVTFHGFFRNFIHQHHAIGTFAEALFTPCAYFLINDLYRQIIILIKRIGRTNFSTWRWFTLPANVRIFYARYRFIQTGVTTTLNPDQTIPWIEHTRTMKH